MKKAALFILTVVLGAFMLTACADPVVPGSSWADKETLSYVAYATADTEKANPLFTMTTVMENLPKGSYALSTSPDKTYEMGSSARRYTVTATDKDGKEVLYSESLMDVFTSVASHKKVDFNGKNYTYDTVLDGKYLNYTLTKGENTVTDSIKVGSTYIDNELIYAYVRTYSSAESNLNSSVSVVDVYNEQLVTLNLQTLSTGETTLKDYAAEPDRKVNAARVQISRKSTPVGYPIVVDFSVTGGDNPFIFRSETTNSVSKRIPLQIIENDIVYYLTSVSVD